MIDYNDQFAELYTLSLNQLKQELNAYTDEANIWKIGGSVSNSAGNLTLHLIGNLNHFYGATLGETGYVRDRESEFSSKGIARAVLIEELDKAIAMMALVHEQLTNDDMDKTFPLKKGDKDVPTIHFMIHLFGHFSYHLGQINYHRRLLDK